MSEEKDEDEQSSSDESTEFRGYQRLESVPYIQNNNSNNVVIGLPPPDGNKVGRIRAKNAFSRIADGFPIAKIPSPNCFGTAAVSVAENIEVSNRDVEPDMDVELVSLNSSSIPQSLESNLHVANTPETSKADFHGFSLPSHLIKYLDQLYEEEGEFWDTCIFKGTELICYLLDRLGDALVVSHIPIEEVASEKLKTALQALDDVGAAGFRLGHLKDNDVKIKAFENSKSEKVAVEADLKQISTSI